jgi:ferritin-like metal-binding protein YciE
MAEVGSKVQVLMAGMAKDNLVKAALKDYATEHMEIASYRSLIIAANEAGQTAIAEACQGILQDEEAMAGWVEEQ